MNHRSGSRLAVIGGGVIGLSIAWHAARSGWSVRVLDAGLPGASTVAGGMLAPLSEGWPGEDVALELGATSLALWPEYAADLARSAECDSLITATGALTVAFDSADAEDLRTVAGWVSERGHDVEILTRAGVRELEPALSRTVRSGLLARGELAVDNRRLLDALRTAVERAGGVIETVAARDPSGVDADQVVVSAGWRSAELAGVPVRPVKGEILRVRAGAGSSPPPRMTVRASVNGRALYLVPRPGGLVVGATQYEHGDDTTVTVAGVRDLVGDAERVFPAIGDYELLQASAGLRPMSRDNVPVIGRVDDRTVVASGHGRNGMLMAPLTARAVLAELAGDPLPEMKPALPERFTTKDCAL